MLESYFVYQKVPNIIKCVFALFLTIHFINAKNVNFTIEGKYYPCFDLNSIKVEFYRD
jgi:hypothetical protein